MATFLKYSYQSNEGHFVDNCESLLPSKIARACKYTSF